MDFSIKITCDEIALRWAIRRYNAIVTIGRWRGLNTGCREELDLLRGPDFQDLVTIAVLGQPLGFRMRLDVDGFLLEPEVEGAPKQSNAVLFAAAFYRANPKGVTKECTTTTTTTANPLGMTA